MWSVPWYWASLSPQLRDVFVNVSYPVYEVLLYHTKNSQLLLSSYLNSGLYSLGTEFAVIQKGLIKIVF